MYDYCTQGWPVSVEETTGSGTILVYPNPTNSYLNIDTRLDVDVEIYDMLGKQMINKENVKRIDISSFPSGIYNMMITYDRMRWNKKIIKE
jgi:hypothetical protein